GGSEANESSYKLSRFYWMQKGFSEKKKIISLKRGYHGVTMATQTATGIDGFHDFSRSNVADIIHAKPHLLDCELGDTNNPDYKDSIRGIIEREGADTIAAVVIETIQGSGGVHMPPEGYLEAVSKTCDEFNIHFIADEVICGFGRTGKMFGVDNWGIVPDMMCLAKGITSGYSQLGGVLIKKDIRDTLVEYDDVLAHGFTYSGHPTACAVGLKTLEIIERDNIVSHVKDMEEVMLNGLQYLENKHDIVSKSRSKGLMAGFELFADAATEKPFTKIKAAAEVVEECFKRKLLLRPLDFEEGVNIVALAPPLIITKEEIETIIDITDEAITSFR